ncbi:MAG: hypothetical protein AAFY76_00765 [Cyanobacteria bacterium J06649_11]
MKYRTKKWVWILSILLIPIIGLVSINEITRSSLNTNGHKRGGEIYAINSGGKSYGKCSWACHDHTDFCKKNHISLSESQVKKIDPIYFGIINGLRSTGNYGLANILILVIFIPLLIYYLFVSSILMQVKITELKKGKNDG